MNPPRVPFRDERHGERGGQHGRDERDFPEEVAIVRPAKHTG